MVGSAGVRPGGTSELTDRDLLDWIVGSLAYRVGLVVFWVAEIVWAVRVGSLMMGYMGFVCLGVAVDPWLRKSG